MRQFPVYEQDYLFAFQLRHHKFVLPKYQRGYVWSEDQALFLVETMLRGLPIGSVILWRQGESTLVLDGQQRISTLLSMQMGNGGTVPEVSLRFDGKKCVPVVGTGPGLLPVKTLFTANLRAMGLAAAGLDVSVLSEKECSALFLTAEWDEAALDAFAKAETLLQAAALPALCFTHRATKDDVREGFRRINLGGSPISPEQLDQLLADS